MSFQNKLMTAKSDIYATYLQTVLATWPKSNSGLYATYDGIGRMDVYDNSLLANVCIMLSTCGDYPALLLVAKNIVTSLTTKIEAFQNNEWLPAAYGGVNDDVFEYVEDLGNNSMVCIALAKWVRQYPEDPLTPRVHAAIAKLLTSIMLLACPGSTGIKRHRDDGDSISTEHMIDVTALGEILLGIDGLSDMGQTLIDRGRPFVEKMYTESGEDVNGTYYAVGSMGDCSSDTNNGSGIPADTTSWNTLATADLNTDRLGNALTSIYGRVMVPSVSAPGTAFAINQNGPDTNAAQYENTGAMLLALDVYRRDTGTDVTESWSNEFTDNIDATYTLIAGKIDSNEPIAAAYEVTPDMSGYDGCTGGSCNCSCIGVGWCYPVGQRHLAATVYCVCAMASHEGMQNMNVYRYTNTCGEDTQSPPPVDPDGPPVVPPNPDDDNGSDGGSDVIVITLSILLGVSIINIIILAVLLASLRV
jgi:hypothetical protein